MKECQKKVRNILAICWGMQVAVTAAGGEVKKAADPNAQGEYVECEVTTVKVDFTKVKKEKDGKAKTELPGATRSSEGKT